MTAAATTDETRVEFIDPYTARRWIERGEAVLVDVREPQEFALEHIAGATSLPLSKFAPNRLPDTRNRRLVLMCASGIRCGLAAQTLLGAGHPTLYRLAGGLMAWRASGGAVVSWDEDQRSR